MPKVSVAIPHELDPDEVVERAGPYVEKIVEDFQGEDLEIEWDGRSANFSFKSLTFKIRGDVAVSDSDIGVSVDLPFAAMIFKDKVEKAIAKNMKRAIEGGVADAAGQSADAPGDDAGNGAEEVT